MYQWICSNILWVVLLFCWWFPLLCKNFLVWWSPISLIFSFVSLAWGNISDKKFLWAMSEILLFLFSSRIFMALGLTFKSLIHLEFILVCGIRMWCSFIFLHVSVQFSQHHLLNTLSLPHCRCLLPLSNTNWLWRYVYFWAPYSVPLIYVSVFMPVSGCFDTMALWYSLILGNVIPPTSFFFLRIAVAMQGLLWIYINFWNVCSSSV